MTKNNINSVYILGLGALGGLYAAKLYDLDRSIVTIVADKKRVSAFKESGFNVNNKPYNFNFISPGDDQPPADLVIIAVKHAQLLEAIADIKGFIGKNTIIISLLNGILSERIIGEAIGFEHLLYAYGVGMDAVRQGNAINYSNPGKVVFGEQSNKMFSKRVEAVKKLFDRAKIPHEIPADMNKALWGKFMMNVGINQASAILKAPYGLFQQNENARKLMIMAAMEVLTLSESCGVNLTAENVDTFLRILDTLDPAGKTSMLQDVEAGRKTEVDIFAGTVIELGKKYGVATPVNEAIYYMIKATEAA